MNKIKICAVSYLNTVPLVWGMLHGRQKDKFELLFRVPAECADLLASGGADIGIVPSFELRRQALSTIPGLGIACRGAVRSILLVSKYPAPEIRTLAADSSSRTSVALSRIILKQLYGTEPKVVGCPPALEPMLEAADAALIIGDPALRLEPEELPFHVYDLGQEWFDLTGLPMVFAMWAGRPGVITPEIIGAFQDSFRFGAEHLETIIQVESERRRFPRDLVESYLTSHILFELGPSQYRGLEAFLNAAHPAPQPATTRPGSSV